MGMTLEECIEKIAELTEDRSRLVKNRHKHADVIIAWANGEDVEWYDPLNARWYPIIATDKALVCWGMTDYEYRIKPKEKDTWKPCASGQLRFVKRLVEAPTKLPNTESLGVVVHKIRTNILQQMMVNQKAEYKWMDVPVEEKDE